MLVFSCWVFALSPEGAGASIAAGMNEGVEAVGVLGDQVKLENGAGVVVVVVVVAVVVLLVLMGVGRELKEGWPKYDAEMENGLELIPGIG